MNERDWKEIKDWKEIRDVLVEDLKKCGSEEEFQCLLSVIAAAFRIAVEKKMGELIELIKRI